MLFISVKNSQEDILIPKAWRKEENLRASGDHPMCLRLLWSWSFREKTGVGVRREGKEGLWLTGMAESLP